MKATQFLMKSLVLLFKVILISVIGASSHLFIAYLGVDLSAFPSSDEVIIGTVFMLAGALIFGVIRMKLNKKS